MPHGNRAAGLQTFSLLDTASDPDDTTLIAAPGASTKINLIRALIMVTVPQSGAEIILEDGVGGAILGAANAAIGGTTVVDYGMNGRVLTAATLLNATIAGATGVVAGVWVEFTTVV